MSKLPDYYKKNLNVLKKSHPNLWKTIIDNECKPVGDVFFSKNGQLNIKVADSDGTARTLHNPDNPKIEIAEALSVIPEQSTGVAILIGMGLGYIIFGILQNRPQIRHLIVFDLEPGIFKQALQVMDFSKILEDPRLILSFGSHPDLTEVLAPANKALHLETTHKLEHLFSYQYREADYKDFDEKIFKYINTKSIVGATDQLFGKKFIENRLTVLNTLQHHFLLETLMGSGKDKPAILVAGGPSLDKNIDLLQKAKGKTIIIAVDSVLPALLEHNVTPDFITAIDPQRLNYEKIAECPTQKINEISLIASPYVTPEIHQWKPFSKIFWAFSHKGIESWMSNLVNGKMLTFGSGTSAHLNLTAAIIMQCSPIIFMGQDLAYTENKDHASGIALNNPEKSQKKSYDSDPNTVWLKGIYGGKVPSHRSYLSFKTFFEEMISQNSGPQYINSTEGGAHISGTEAVPFQDVLDKFITKEDIPTDSFKEPTPCNATQLTANIQKTLQDITNTIKIVNKYTKLINTILSQFKRIEKQPFLRSEKNLPNDLRTKIHNAEILEKKMDQRGNGYLWEILEEASMEDVKKSQRILHEIKTTVDPKNEYFIINFKKNLDRLVALNKARKKILLFLQNKLTAIIKFHKKEAELIKQIEAKLDIEQNLIKLSEHYFDSNNFTLMQPVLTQLLSITPNHPRAQFYMGIIAAVQCRFNESDDYFTNAKKTAPSITQQINAFSNAQGNIYYNWGYKQTPEKQTDSIISRKMLFKGLRYCPKHSKLKKEIQDLASRDLIIIQSALDSGSIGDVEPIIAIWHKNLKTDKNISFCISDDQMADFMYIYAYSLFLKNNFHHALKSIDTAIKHAPKNPELFVMAANICFAKSDFPNGSIYLKKAVAMAPSHAVVWENIGDELQTAGQYEDAITAYEQGVMKLPNKTSLLKKIGDCYQKNGQLEAALEIYNMVKKEINSTIEANKI